jgi:hypothetical protein
VLAVNGKPGGVNPESRPANIILCTKHLACWRNIGTIALSATRANVVGRVIVEYLTSLTGGSMAKSSGRKFSIGVDYGTNSVRALVVDTADGAEIASHVYDYPSGEAGVLLDLKDPNLARQSPADYIDGFHASVRKAVAAAKKKRGFKPENVVGIGIDTTGSTPIPVDRDGKPLALDPKFKKKLAAQAWLWKDHTAHAEAAAITAKARQDRIAIALRRHVFQRVVLVEDLALQARGPEDVCGRDQLGRAGRFRSRVHHGQHEPAHDEARHLRGRPQGDVQREVGRPAPDRVPGIARPRFGRGASIIRARSCRPIAWPGI